MAAKQSITLSMGVSVYTLRIHSPKISHLVVIIECSYVLTRPMTLKLHGFSGGIGHRHCQFCVALQNTPQTQYSSTKKKKKKKVLLMGTNARSLRSDIDSLVYKLFLFHCLEPIYFPLHYLSFIPLACFIFIFLIVLFFLVDKTMLKSWLPSFCLAIPLL